MYHSITFGEKDKLLAALSDPSAEDAWNQCKRNTWDDWFLIPSSRPSFAVPGANIQLVEVPGANGSLNLSKSMTGYVTYKSRSGAFDFIIDNGHWASWVDAYHDIMAYTHGADLVAILEDDPGYYYEGVWTFGSFSSGASNSSITLNYTVQPFKKAFESSENGWLWDPFEFARDVISDPTSDLVVDGSLDVTIHCGDEPVSPTFIVGNHSSLQVAYDNKTYTLPVGTTTIRKIKMAGGEKTLTFTGTGTVTIKYRAGWF